MENFNLKQTGVQVQELLDAIPDKADKATTLEGYGITDAYTKAEDDALLETKADKSDTYTKEQTDGLLDTKADNGTTLSDYGITDAYTKDEVDDLLDEKADKATTLAGYGIGDAYTKAEVNNLITTPDQQYVTVEATDQTTAATDVLPATGASDTIYRVGNWDGTQYDQTNYSEYAWDGTQYVLLDTKDFTLATASDFDNPTAAQQAKIPTVGAILDCMDTTPTAGSVKPVQSNGIYYAISAAADGIVHGIPSNNDETILIKNEDETETFVEITSQYVNAKNLKSNGLDVLTAGDYYTKGETNALLDEKQELIDNLSQVAATSNKESMVFASDEFDNEGNGEKYAEIDDKGVTAKGFYNQEGCEIVDLLCGKKWAVFGDSFTEGTEEIPLFTEGKYVGKKKVYPYIIGNRTGIEVLNFFQSGRTLAFPAVPGDFVNSATYPSGTKYFQNVPQDVDYITFYLGINDSHHAPGSGGGDGEDNTGEIPLGTISDNTTATYYGAWNVVLSWLIENRPFAHIGIIVSNGCDTSAYRDAQIAIARKYGISFIDLNGDDRTPFMLRSQNTAIDSTIRTIRTQKQSVDYDGSKTGTVNRHPNEDAHQFESVFIENYLRTI